MEELKSSRSVAGKDFPNFEMLDAKIASALNRLIQNSQFKKKVSLEEGEKVFVTSGKIKGRDRRETNAVFGMRVTIVRNRHRKPNHPLSHNLRKHEVGVCREKEMPEAEASLRSSIDRRARHLHKSPCEYWHPPECQFQKTKSGCKFGAECSFPHWKVEEQPNKKQKDEGKKCSCYCEKCSCVSQDTEEPPDSRTTSMKGKKSVGTNATSTIHKGCIASSKHPRKTRSVAREN